jgi:hypothetical protein
MVLYEFLEDDLIRVIEEVTSLGKVLGAFNATFLRKYCKDSKNLFIFLRFVTKEGNHMVMEEISNEYSIVALSSFKQDKIP